MRYVVPLAIFIVLVTVLAVGLRLDPHYVPSPLIDKNLPAFTLPRLSDANATLSNADLRGRPILLNVWASWCVACRQEHPVLLELAKRGEVEIIGLNYKDTREAANQVLTQHGNPYRENAFDAEGHVGLDLGVYGVPESFVIDGEGVIRYKQVGVLTPEVLDQTILPLMRKLAGKKS